MKNTLQGTLHCHNMLDQRDTAKRECLQNIVTTWDNKNSMKQLGLSVLPRRRNDASLVAEIRTKIGDRSPTVKQ